MIGNSEKVLVVDDEAVNLQLMEGLLSPLGYMVDLARDGFEALDKVAAQPPDVILLDIMMPRMDGFEVARRLKAEEETRHIPVVVVSALQDVEFRVRALEAGADDFLTKPVEINELRARVRSLLKVKAYNDHMRNYQKQLEADVAERTAQLNDAFNKIKYGSLETIHRLAKAAEYKDEDTGAHVLRMSNYSAALARKLGLAEERVEAILYAAPMHDVGKIGIPDRILLKPGKLDAAEWVIMKQHAEIGARILDHSDYRVIRLAETLAITHHEKWDGSGYPRGLANTDIPIEGRIVALADVFDALTSKRPYKGPFSLEKSYAIIREGRGSHFDPDVVDAFFAIEEEILAIKGKYRDEDQSLLLRMQVSEDAAEPAAPVVAEAAGEFIVWSPEYELGSAIFDRQHRDITTIINTLYGALTRKEEGASEVPEIFQRLGSAVDAHLQEEEDMMSGCDVPERQKHKEMHDWMRRETHALRQKFMRNPEALSDEVLCFLRDLWLNHILEVDKQYIPCFTGKKPSAS